MTDWMRTIHVKANPYDGFPAHEFVADLQGWGHDSPIFEQVIATYRPALMIEVGSWKGASAIKTADLMKRHNITNPQLICVDTWLGSVEMWLEPRWFDSLAFKWGRPQLYNTFMTNVIRAGHTDIIIPFPVDTSTAAKFLKLKGMQADIIYLDASHEYQDVKADLTAYWQVLRPGGIFIGDDYSDYYPGVPRAVNEFAGSLGLPVNSSFLGKFFIIRPVHSP